MHTCQEMEAVLTDFLFDELTEAEMAAVMQHLAVCSSCRETLAELEQTILLLRAPVAQVPESPLALAPDRMAAILTVAAAQEPAAPPMDAMPNETAAAAPANKPLELVWLAVAAAAILAMGVTIFLALRDESVTTGNDPAEIADDNSLPHATEQVVQPEKHPQPKPVPAPKAPEIANDDARPPAPRKPPATPKQPDKTETVTQIPAPQPKPEPAPTQPETVAAKQPAESIAPPKPKPRPSTARTPVEPRPRPEPTPPPRQIVRRPAPVVKPEPKPEPPKPEPAKPPTAFAWTRDLHNRLMVSNQHVSLVVAVPARDVKDPLKLESGTSSTASTAKGALADAQQAAKIGGLVLETDPSGFVLKQPDMNTRSYRQSPEYADRAIALANKLESIGCSMPQVKYSKRRQRLNVRGDDDQIKDFHGLIGIARQYKRDVRIGPEAEPGHDPNAPTEESYVRTSRSRPPTDRRPSLSSSQSLTAKADKGSSRPSRSGSRDVITVRTASGQQTDSYPETKWGTPLKNVVLTNLSPRDAIARVAKAGNLDVKYRAGRSDLRLAVFSKEITPVDALHLICRAADLQLEIDGRELKVSHGPYAPRLETRIYRLSKRDTEAIVGEDVKADLKIVRTALPARGLSLPPGAAVEYEPNQGVLIVRSCPEDLEFLEKEVLR